MKRARLIIAAALGSMYGEILPSIESLKTRHNIMNAPADALQTERIAVLGFGHLGRPFSQNLRDSGVTDLVVGNIADEYAEQARAQGFEVLPIAEATARADICLVLLSDEVIPEIFESEIAPNLKPGAAIVFASGYTLAYGLITPPPGIDVLLLAPRMAGENARQRYLNQQGFFAYISSQH